MATIPHVAAGGTARAAEQNALIDQVNTNTSGIGTANNTLSSYGTRITTLENKPSGGSNAGAYFGQWTDNNDAGGQTVSGVDGVKLTPWTVAVGTPGGCSMSNGTLTVQQSGLWYITASTQYTGGTAVRALWLSASSAGSGAGLAKVGSIAGPSMDVQTASGLFRLSANAVVSAYAAIWQGGDPVNLYRVRSNTLTAAWLGP